MKDAITDILRKLSYKNTSLDTTIGRNIIADEIIKYIDIEKRKHRYAETDQWEVGSQEDYNGG